MLTRLEAMTELDYFWRGSASARRGERGTLETMFANALWQSVYGMEEDRKRAIEILDGSFQIERKKNDG